MFFACELSFVYVTDNQVHWCLVDNPALSHPTIQQKAENQQWQPSSKNVFEIKLTDA